MATDHDASRQLADSELDTDSVEVLAATESSSPDVDDDPEIVKPAELPAQGLFGDELNVDIVPRQSDEFTCASCFLVQRNNRISHTEPDGSIICLDCA